MREIGKQTHLLFLSIVVIAASFIVLLNYKLASAAQITNRSLTLQAGPSDGGSKAGGVVNHQFAFTLPGGSSVGSIKFEYCTTATLNTCVTPTGLVTTSGATALGSETGAMGFTLNKATNGAPYLTRTAAAVAANQVVTYRLDNITNPTANNTTFFVRIATYASTNTTGTPIDTGTVNASTAEPIVLTGIMPESLIFCTGATVNVNCTTTTAGAVSFNQLFSPTDTATATSQMSASTNAFSGYSITVNGTTMTSGANTIPAMAVAAVGTKGTGQFGMNLRLNTVATSTVAVGADITPASNNGDFTARAQTGYDTVDSFKYVSGNVVADSGSDGTPGPTNSQVYTASYIVNVAGNQLAGTYSTTLTYVCTPTF